MFLYLLCVCRSEFKTPFPHTPVKGKQRNKKNKKTKKKDEKTKHKEHPFRISWKEGCFGRLEADFILKSTLWKKLSVNSSLMSCSSRMYALVRQNVPRVFHHIDWPSIEIKLMSFKRLTLSLAVNCSNESKCTYVHVWIVCANYKGFGSSDTYTIQQDSLLLKEIPDHYLLHTHKFHCYVVLCQ